MAEPERPAPPVVARQLHKAFGGTVALDAVDLVVPPGSIVGLIGPSGCGKTTLIRVLTGVYEPDDGEARVFGVDPGRFRAADRRRFGYQPQAPVLFPNLTLWGNLTFVASMYGVPLWHRGRRLRELMDFVDLGAQRRTLFAQASGGMQRRVALAATLVHDPLLLFLDEPTAGVDPILRERFWSRFRELRDGGRAMLVSTQYVGEAASCDRVAVMADGHLVTMDTPDGLRRRAYAGQVLDVSAAGQDRRAARQVVDSIVAVTEVVERDDGLTIVVRDGADAIATVQAALRQAGVSADVREAAPDFDEVFVRLIQQHRTAVRAGEPAGARS